MIDYSFSVSIDRQYVALIGDAGISSYIMANKTHSLNYQTQRKSRKIYQKKAITIVTVKIVKCHLYSIFGIEEFLNEPD